MDPADFDRLIARASDPRLIPGIYNYCDGRCPRCPFTERCLSYLDNLELEAAEGSSSLADLMSASLGRTIEMIAEEARREGVEMIDLQRSASAPEANTVDDDSDEDDGKYSDEGERSHRRDRLVLRAREYGLLAFRIAHALSPIVERRGEPAVIDAVETLGWFSTLIGSKIFRAVAGQADGRPEHDDIQADFNGSAKVALLGIAESRTAWGVLMEVGKATADGVPAYAVKLLDVLDREIRTRFPRATDFIRPGFDEPDIAAGAPAPLLPLATRQPLLPP